MLTVSVEQHEAKQEVSPPVAAEQPQRDTPVYVGSRSMSVDRWIGVPANRRQRDTEKHAKRAKHLRVLHPTHMRVNAAALPDGRLVKLDGHTRALLWEQGKLARPPVVVADIWACANEDEAAELYSTFDNTNAVETSSDQMFGARNERGLKFESELLRTGLFVHSLRFSYVLVYGRAKADQIDVHGLVKEWEEELKRLDTCEPTRTRFVSGVTVAALISLRVFGKGAVDFWTTYGKDGGRKDETKTDPVEMLTQAVKERRYRKRLVGEANTFDVARIALGAFMRWRKNEDYTAHERRIGEDKTLTVSPTLQPIRADRFQRLLRAARRASKAQG